MMFDPKMLQVSLPSNIEKKEIQSYGLMNE